VRISVKKELIPFIALYAMLVALTVIFLFNYNKKKYPRFIDGSEYVRRYLPPVITH